MSVSFHAKNIVYNEYQSSCEFVHNTKFVKAWNFSRGLSLLASLTSFVSPSNYLDRSQSARLGTFVYLCCLHLLVLILMMRMTHHSSSDMYEQQVGVSLSVKDTRASKSFVGRVLLADAL